MIDQRQIDLLALVNHYTQLKKATADEWHGACPFCGGVDRFRVNTRKQSWHCRQRCSKGGDAVAFIMRIDGIDFPTALERLGLRGDNPTPRTTRKRVTRPENAPVSADFGKPAVENADWQTAAQDYVLNCSKRLWRNSGVEALEYLKWRGLTERVLSDNLVGYNPVTRRELWGDVEVTLFQGITLPNIFAQKVMSIKTRTWDGKPDKYIQVRGGFQSLYHSGFRVPHFTGIPRKFSTAVLVESELDALSIQAGSGGCLNITTFATGGSEGCKRLLWVNRVAVCQRVLLAFDNDQAGENATAWWASQLGDRAFRLTPTRHDVNEMLTSGDDIEAWLNPHIAPPEFDRLPSGWIKAAQS